MATSPFNSVLAKKLNTFIPLSSGELKCLADMQLNTVKVKRGQQLTHEGQTGHKAFVLQAGWACSYKLLPDGGRQIISFPIAGDIVGLRSVLLRTADHSFAALTDAVVNPVEGTHILKCVTEFPRLGAALMWAASRDEAMVVEHLVNIGPAQRHRTHGSFLHGTGRTAEFGRPGHRSRVQVPAHSVGPR